jgi:60 kDa SS-A/Ro ribonucleoprotein
VIYSKDFNPSQTPQTEKIIGSSQVQNRAGGFSWKVDSWERMKRFLILGNEGGTFYAKQKNLTRSAAESVLSCASLDPLRAVGLVREISLEARAPKQEPGLFALALLASHDRPEVREAALKVVGDVCRTGSTLLQWVAMVDQFRGWGSGLRNALRKWYEDKEIEAVAYQILKYRQRAGWTHRDILRKVKPKPRDARWNALYSYIAKGLTHTELPSQVHAYEAIWNSNPTPPMIKSLVKEHRLSMDMLPNTLQSDPRIWKAILPHQPLGNLMRNLATMTRVGALKPMGGTIPPICDRLTSRVELAKARIHPIQALMAGLTYGEGKGLRGSHTWTPIPQITAALNKAFYKAFSDVEPTYKRVLIAIDVSGSMEWGCVAGIPSFSPRIAAACLGMVFARTEPQYMFMAFSDKPMALNITAEDSLAQVVQTTSSLPFGGTDCALPMIWAHSEGITVDTFIVLTDNETWAGQVHPKEALDIYRKHMNPEAKLAVIALEADDFSIADPEDAGMMDFVGFDSALPQVLREFMIS